MFKKNPNVEKTEETVKETKKNAKAATKAAGCQAAKEAGDKLIVGMAQALPGHNSAKSFLSHNFTLDKLDMEAERVNLARRGVRGELRKMRVDLGCLDRVRKLRKMEPEDVVAKKATEALYEEQLSMPLSDEQKQIVKDLNQQREENKKSMLKASGGETGKEVGTSASRVPARQNLDEEEINEETGERKGSFRDVAKADEATETASGLKH